MTRCVDCGRPFGQKEIQAYFTLEDDPVIEFPRKRCFLCMYKLRRIQLAYT